MHNDSPFDGPEIEAEFDRQQAELNEAQQRDPEYYRREISYLLKAAGKNLTELEFRGLMEVVRPVYIRILSELGND